MVETQTIVILGAAALLLYMYRQNALNGTPREVYTGAEDMRTATWSGVLGQRQAGVPGASWDFFNNYNARIYLGQNY